MANPNDFDIDRKLAESRHIQSYARERGEEIVGVDEVLAMLNATLPDEILGPDAVARGLSEFLEGVPDIEPVDFSQIKPGEVAIHYLPNYAGLPEITLGPSSASGYDLFCASRGGFFLNSAESRIATVPCGFALALPANVEAQIRPLPELSEAGIVAQFGSVDSDYRGEVMITLVNLSNTRQEIRRGQRIARMVFTGNLIRPNLVSVKELG